MKAPRWRPPLLFRRVTEFLIALVPLAVAAVPILRWPTLERRLRTHLALLKEVPTDVDAKPLRSLVEQELERVAELDSYRLTKSHREERRELLGRVILFVVGLFTLFPLVLFPEVQSRFSGLPAQAQYLVTVYGLALVVAFQWFVSGLSIRYGIWRANKPPRKLT